MKESYRSSDDGDDSLKVWEFDNVFNNTANVMTSVGKDNENEVPHMQHNARLQGIPGAIADGHTKMFGTNAENRL